MGLKSRKTEAARVELAQANAGPAQADQAPLPDESMPALQTQSRQLPSPARGQKVGDYTLTRLLGQGGNGQVWLALDGNGEEVAIKLLTKVRPTAYQRFRDEIDIMRQNASIPGILPVLSFELPEDSTTARPWYAMPVAKPVLDHLANGSLTDKVAAIAAIAETLARLHEREIIHRDIKPANLLVREGEYFLGDFGLVDFPDKADLTGAREDLGPRWTMAPEVRRHEDGAHSPAADVYSLAKTLWILITGETQGFDGQYTITGSISLRRHAPPHMHMGTLEDLLVESTEHHPRRRPTMAAFGTRLKQWLAITASFPESNRLEWINVQSRLFPIAPPNRAIWDEINTIVQILQFLGERSHLNHLFLPSGGGLDLERAVRSHREEGCIEMVATGLILLVKPRRLLFESFYDDPQWNYFRLEADELTPSGVYPNLDPEFGREELTDVGGKMYAPRSVWDSDEYNGEPLPPGSRKLTRYFRGAFVIFHTTSIYNQTKSTYDSRHDKMNADEFRQHISGAIKYLARHRQEQDVGS